jgi:hypothetical protein
MKNILLLSVIFLCSCASKPQEVNDGRRGKVVTVGFKDASAKDDISKKKGALGDALASEKKWYRMADDSVIMRRYLKKSAAELGRMLIGADAKETSRIVNALSQKGFFGIPELAKVLSDKRAVVFSKQALRWYEEKNKPSEDLELRVYAAYFMERASTVDAYGVKFFVSNKSAKEGFVEILYATKGVYAVSKEDVCQTWIKWWNINKENYQ